MHVLCSAAEYQFLANDRTPHKHTHTQATQNDTANRTVSSSIYLRRQMCIFTLRLAASYFSRLREQVNTSERAILIHLTSIDIAKFKLLIHKWYKFSSPNTR